MMKLKFLYTKFFLLILVLFFISVDSYAFPGKEDYKCKFYTAYIKGDMTEWPEWIDQLERLYRDHEDPELLNELLVAYYGYVAYLIGVDEDKTAENYIEEAEPYIEKLKNHQAYKASVEALHGAFIAYKIGINKARAIYLGPKSMKHINNAIEIDPDNPKGWMEKGNAEYHMPRYLGGSYEQSAEYYKRAIACFENNDSEAKCSWIYLNAHAWLAQSYQKMGAIDKARSTYEKILSIEPGFTWVSEELYPEFQKKHKSF